MDATTSKQYWTAVHCIRKVRDLHARKSMHLQVQVKKDWHYVMTRTEDNEMCSYDTIAFEAISWQYPPECAQRLLLVAFLHRSD